MIFTENEPAILYLPLPKYVQQDTNGFLTYLQPDGGRDPTANTNLWLTIWLPNGTTLFHKALGEVATDLSDLGYGAVTFLEMVPSVGTQVDTAIKLTLHADWLGGTVHSGMWGARLAPATATVGPTDKYGTKGDAPLVQWQWGPGTGSLLELLNNIWAAIGYPGDSGYMSVAEHVTDVAEVLATVDTKLGAYTLPRTVSTDLAVLGDPADYPAGGATTIAQQAALTLEGVTTVNQLDSDTPLRQALSGDLYGSGLYRILTLDASPLQTALASILANTSTALQRIGVPASGNVSTLLATLQASVTAAASDATTRLTSIGNRLGTYNTGSVQADFATIRAWLGDYDGSQSTVKDNLQTLSIYAQIGALLDMGTTEYSADRSQLHVTYQYKSADMDLGTFPLAYVSSGVHKGKLLRRGQIVPGADFPAQGGGSSGGPTGVQDQWTLSFAGTRALSGFDALTGHLGGVEYVGAELGGTLADMTAAVARAFGWNGYGERAIRLITLPELIQPMMEVRVELADTVVALVAPTGAPVGGDAVALALRSNFSLLGWAATSFGRLLMLSGPPHEVRGEQAVLRVGGAAVPDAIMSPCNGKAAQTEYEVWYTLGETSILVKRINYGHNDDHPLVTAAGAIVVTPTHTQVGA